MGEFLTDLYHRWNESIANHFFREEHAGREVFLFVDDNRIAAIGRDNSLPGGSFLEAVAPSGTPASDVAKACLHQCDGGAWRKRSHVPPYIAYLALFVLAAGQDEEDLPDNAYYNRLRRLLGLPDGPQLPGFARLGDEVWSDLEAWSTTDMDGDLGIFRVRIQGAHRHVGIPRSQTLLWDEELKALPAVFSSSGLDPTDDPSDSAIVLALLEPPRLVRPPTQKTLLRPNSDVLRRALIDVVRDELWHWDGNVDIADGPANKRTYGSIRICIRLNIARRTGVSTLRCRLASPFPEGEIELTDGHQLYSCEEFSGPWSQQLSADGVTVDAAEFDWEQGITLVSDRGYEFKMRGSPIRVFEAGEGHQLAGWVEVTRIARGRDYLVACVDSLSSGLADWGSSSCDRYEPLDYANVVPKSWELFRVSNIRSDKWIADVSPTLAFPTSTLVRLVGGVKSGRGSKYYAFAPPAIHVTTEAEKVTVSVDDQTLVPRSGFQLQLPSNLPLGQSLIVRVRDEHGEQLASQSLVLIDQVDWRDSGVLLRVDGFGEPTSAQGFCGAFSDDPLNHGSTAWPAWDYVDPTKQLVLIGKRPGEISRWPESPWPSWTPVWAIASAQAKKSRNITYCGSALQSDGPLLAEPVGNKKKVRQWKIQINHRRRRSAGPAIPKLNELWRNYVDVASRI